MNILLTGKPGIGKSTAIQRIIDLLGKNKAGGFWTREIRDKGRRVGFLIQTLNGLSEVLAHVELDTGPRVGKYTVSVEAIKRIAIPAMQQARESDKIIIIDEIASMELKSPQFAPEVRRCLNTGRVLGTLQQKTGKFHDEVRNRPDTILLNMTVENRDAIPAHVLNLLK